MKLVNLNSIVTGGANGIGRSIALRLAREGANVAIADLEIESAARVAEEIRELDKKALALKVDVANNAETAQMAAISLHELGSIDILINCAGGPNLSDILFHESSEEDWDRMVDVNLKGVRNCTRAVINHMIKRRKGKIVNISSLAGMIGNYGSVAYSAAKAGIIGFTMALAKEVAGYGINVNSVSPGAIFTRGMQSLPARIIQSEKLTGLGRLGQPDEVASLVVFLASKEANFITGQNYPICGLKNLGFTESFQPYCNI